MQYGIVGILVVVILVVVLLILLGVIQALLLWGSLTQGLRPLVCPLADGGIRSVRTTRRPGWLFVAANPAFGLPTDSRG